MNHFITLHHKGKVRYFRPDAIIVIGEDGNGGASFSIGTQFAQLVDETPEQVLELIAASWWGMNR